MFIEPESNASVPFVVVMRTLSNAPERVPVPPPVITFEASDLKAWEEIQIFPEIILKIICPEIVADEFPFPVM